MLARTHVAITFAALFLFLPKVENIGMVTFFSVAFIATLLPDIDTAFSFLGKSKFSKVPQFFTKHRGVLHSLSFCVFVSLILAFIFPVLAFPFFLGYSLHIFADSFTRGGIRPFWPSKKKTSWKIAVGGYVESTIFVLFLILDLFLFILLFIK